VDAAARAVAALSPVDALHLQLDAVAWVAWVANPETMTTTRRAERRPRAASVVSAARAVSVASRALAARRASAANPAVAVRQRALVVKPRALAARPLVRVAKRYRWPAPAVLRAEGRALLRVLDLPATVFA
jgi:hypothetical protein